MKTPISIFLLVLVLSISVIARGQSTAVNVLDTFLDSAEKALDFNGVVLIAKGDSLILHKGYGYSDRKAKRRTDKNTVFQIASITKAFTAVAIVKLAELRKINLQDPITKYFKDVSADKATITIHQLLSHQSGLPQTYAAEGKTDYSKALQAVLKVPLEALPGTRSIYSNGNYSLLALLVEKVTGSTGKRI